MTVELVLFDLGGVLIELTQLKPLWFGTRDDSEEDLWNLWLTCDLPSRMDSGKLTTDEFVEAWRTRWGIGAPHDEVKSAYQNLIVGPLPGALDLVTETRRHTATGCLSNMNPCHWPRVSQFGFGELFDHSFVSHQVGHAKPDPEIFEHVIESIPCEPDRTLFLDDNILNVEAALDFGLRAERVVGVKGALDCLIGYEVITTS